ELGSVVLGYDARELGAYAAPLLGVCRAHELLEHRAFDQLLRENLPLTFGDEAQRLRDASAQACHTPEREIPLVFVLGKRHGGASLVLGACRRREELEHDVPAGTATRPQR